MILLYMARRVSRAGYCFHYVYPSRKTIVQYSFKPNVMEWKRVTPHTQIYSRRSKHSCIERTILQRLGRNDAQKLQRLAEQNDQEGGGKKLP